ncbi:flavin reductase family protein [Paeniglutamicibacter cryotolerans]|uniref:Ferredoxin-NADP reductase n=1 Tax=Paeniglutamicibacter cryotolerans TaxID=670079 RepID=A0A839QJP3_9MICC|nr:iron-sulfur cluster-binding domain-containing protein [Paeniglutamicibacter cryotolerans]MBB2996419.1 ferredoxin-NADP reductase [Paeniglutamicibacter cryotolerans]
MSVALQAAEAMPVPAICAPAPFGPDDPADHVLRCTGVRAETAEVKTYTFEPAAGDGFAWAPGQYLTLSTGLPGADASRCYSISSGSAHAAVVELTVKRLPGGPVSAWLHESILPGSLVQVHGPLGSFTPEGLGNAAGAPAPKYLFLAAGSGITPLMGITRTLLAAAASTLPDVVLLNSVHAPAELIFGQELLGIPAASGIRVEVLCSTGGTGHGRLDASLLRGLVPDLADREVYACGPAGYLAAVRTMLDDAGCDPARRHEESFALGTLPAAEPAGGPAAPSRDPATGTFSVRFERSGRTIDCPAGSFVLDAALAAGLALPSSCTLGMCGTCKSPMLSGSVDMNHAGGIRPQEIAAGKILICCSKPLEDLVIDA